MDKNTDNNERFELPAETSVPEKDGCCNAAVRLAVIGIIAGLFIPFIGITFALAVSGLVTNHSERMYYSTGKGFAANIISILLSVISWLVGASIIGFI